MAEDQPAIASGSGRSIRFYLVGLAVIVGAFVAVGYFHLSRNQTVAVAREARGTAVDRGPRVEVVAASQGPSERTVTMLADVRANTTAIMYAKVSGYMKSVAVDRGDRVQAGQTRLRPILMTALAMIIGMVPMALALGEAGEQNAPLGRAVIGGLAFATVATLILVPIFYTLLRRQLPTLHTLDKRFEAEAAGSAAGGSVHG